MLAISFVVNSFALVFEVVSNVYFRYWLGSAGTMVRVISSDKHPAYLFGARYD